ncbi:UDP-N-acetylglucosamine 2-epimerase, partial [Leptothrix ochracea]
PLVTVVPEPVMAVPVSVDPRKDWRPKVDVVPEVVAQLTHLQHRPLRPGQQVLMALADTSADLLTLAVLLRTWRDRGDAPYLVLVQPNAQLDLQLWDRRSVQSVLPQPDAEILLTLPKGIFEDVFAHVAEHLSPLLDSYQPAALLSQGESDAALACALLVHQQGIKLVRLDGGRRHSPLLRENAVMMDQSADWLYADITTPADDVLRHCGVSPKRVCPTGALSADAWHMLRPRLPSLPQVWLDARVPVWLGPTWLDHHQGEPFAVITLELNANDETATEDCVNSVRELAQSTRIFWLMSRSTRVAMTRWMAHPRRRQWSDVALLWDPAAARLSSFAADAAVNVVRLWCGELPALADQVAVLAASAALLAQPGHFLAEMARPAGIPTLLRSGAEFWLDASAQEEVERHAWDDDTVAQHLLGWGRDTAAANHLRRAEASQTGAAVTIINHMALQQSLASA